MLHSDHAANLRLFFFICDKGRISHDAAQIQGQISPCVRSKVVRKLLFSKFCKVYILTDDLNLRINKISIFQISTFDFMPISKFSFGSATVVKTCYFINVFEPRSEKTGRRGFRPGPTQTEMCSHRRWLET